MSNNIINSLLFLLLHFHIVIFKRHLLNKDKYYMSTSSSPTFEQGILMSDSRRVKVVVIKTFSSPYQVQSCPRCRAEVEAECTAGYSKPNNSDETLQNSASLHHCRILVGKLLIGPTPGSGPVPSLVMTVDLTTTVVTPPSVHSTAVPITRTGDPQQVRRGGGRGRNRRVAAHQH